MSFLLAFILLVVLIFLQASETPPTNTTPFNFVVDAAAVAFVVKILVDLTKSMVSDAKARFLPAYAIVYGIIIQVLAVMANGATFQVSVVAQQVLAGIISGFGAWASTGIHKRVRS